MKSYLIWTFLAFILLSAASVKADCEEDVKEDDAWYKKVACQVKQGAEEAYKTVKKGAEDGYEAVKPLGDKIATSAKDFGNTVSKKYDEVKHKLTDDDVKIEDRPANFYANEPTEKIPLAPISGPADTKSETKSTSEQ